METASETTMEARSEFDCPATASSELPLMMHPLDTVIAPPDGVQDLKIVTREFPDGQGKFEALHNEQMSNSLLSGTVQSTISTGGSTRYDGTFLNDPHNANPTPHGQGSRVNADGSVYTGQWKDGYPDGRGEWKAPAPSCESYLGDWKKGKKHGFGLQKFENGDLYEGDWATGKFQDRGKYVYANGDEFQGIWENGIKKHGTFYFQDGRVSTRKWENGCLVSSQEFDTRRKSYQPTITKEQAHDPERNSLGTTCMLGMVSPHGVRIN